MRGIVAAHAVNAAYGKVGIAARDRNRDRCFGRENECHDGIDSKWRKLEAQYAREYEFSDALREGD
jgi:hypothetical protein